MSWILHVFPYARFLPRYIVLPVNNTNLIMVIYESRRWTNISLILNYINHPCNIFHISLSFCVANESCDTIRKFTPNLANIIKFQLEMTILSSLLLCTFILIQMILVAGFQFIGLLWKLNLDFSHVSRRYRNALHWQWGNIALLIFTM